MTDASLTPPAPTVADLEENLERQRASLASDLEMLGSRLAPESLKAQARAQVSSTFASLRERAEDLSQPGPSRPCPEGSLCSRASRLIHGQAGALDLGTPLAQLRDRASGLLGHKRSSVESLYAEAAESTDPDEALPPPPPNVVERLRQLLDDARDGDPVALAIATAAVLGLTGLTVAALVKAVRR